MRMRRCLVSGLVGLLMSMQARSDVINHSNHVVYVDDEGLGMIWMLPAGESYIGKNDAVASPFIRRRAIYKTVNNENVEITSDNKLKTSTGSFGSEAAQLLIGGWKDEAWIKKPNGYRFRRLFNLTR